MSVLAKPLFNAKFAKSSAEVEYTAPNETRTIVDKFTATNTDSGALTLTVHLVPSGGAVATSNMILKAYSIAAGVTFDCTELKNQILNGGDFISIFASSADKVVIRASGREIS
jgi:hypothetical protein